MVVRIAGVILPDKKRTIIGLTHIYGIGRTRAQKICFKAGIEYNTRVKDLRETEANKIRSVIESYSYMIEGDLRRFIQTSIKRLISINCYCGLRHKNNLPVHGQRTHTNARTSKRRRVSSVHKEKKVK